MRFHKFKKTSESHEYYFSQQRLYQLHTKTDLNLWENDIEGCKSVFNEARESINYVRSKVMKYQEEVELAQAKAQEEFEYCIGDLLDPTKEQEEADCVDEGFHKPEKFIAFDIKDCVNEDVNAHQGFFKQIELDNLVY